MTGTLRAGLFDEDEPTMTAPRELDVSGFAPKTPARPLPAPEEVKAIAEARGFPSREPGAGDAQSEAARRETKKEREPRRHQTGRNVQFNIKARRDTIDTFHRICDAQGWVRGETLARAIAALERELSAEQKAIARQRTT